MSWIWTNGQLDWLQAGLANGLVSRNGIHKHRTRRMYNILNLLLLRFLGFSSYLEIIPGTLVSRDSYADFVQALSTHVFLNTWLRLHRIGYCCAII